MAQVALITTGGTIASRRDIHTDQVVSSVSGADLKQMLHDDLDGIDIVVDEFCNKSSFAFDLSLAFSLASCINAHLERPECDGVVVTHGTDTMEESAYMADLLLTSAKPVVFTGAQRSADSVDKDGPRNIAEAIRVAASPDAHNIGAIICFEQDFHAARDVRKTHTSRVDTFRSSEHGKLGEIDGEIVRVHRRPLLRKTYTPQAIETEIELIKLVMGSRDQYLRWAADHHAKAIVLEAFGRGNATPSVANAIGDIVSGGIPVIVTSRCSEGRVKPIYGNGGGKELDRAGAIFAGDLSGPKARILASVLLGLQFSNDDLRREFELLGG
jgi:L-asparaginase